MQLSGSWSEESFQQKYMWVGEGLKYCSLCEVGEWGYWYTRQMGTEGWHGPQSNTSYCKLGYKYRRDEPSCMKAENPPSWFSQRYDRPNKWLERVWTRDTVWQLLSLCKTLVSLSLQGTQSKHRARVYAKSKRNLIVPMCWGCPTPEGEVCLVSLYRASFVCRWPTVSLSFGMCLNALGLPCPQVAGGCPPPFICRFKSIRHLKNRRDILGCYKHWE